MELRLDCDELLSKQKSLEEGNTNLIGNQFFRDTNDGEADRRHADAQRDEGGAWLIQGGHLGG
jgi:hypothetical protein